MSKVLEKLAQSLTAKTIEIIPYLPYLLQDLWELGSSPKDIIALIERHVLFNQEMRVLDLACGKGAVSINIAKRFGCHVKGVDLMTAFIEEAKMKAKAYQVTEQCTFLVEDINESVKHERGYDIVILGAVGSVLGTAKETLEKLSNTIVRSGYIIIDDAYANNVNANGYMTKKQWLEVVEQCGVGLIADLIISDDELNEVLNEQMTLLTKRVEELKEKYPEDQHLFDQYLLSQRAECNELTEDVEGVTMLLKKY